MSTKLYRIESRLTEDDTDAFMPMTDADGHTLQYTMPEILRFAADLEKRDWIDFEFQIVPVQYSGRPEPQDLQRLFTEFTRRADGCRTTEPRRERDKRFWTEVSPSMFYTPHIPGLTVEVTLPAEVAA